MHDKETAGRSGHGPPTEQFLLAEDQACLEGLVSTFLPAMEGASPPSTPAGSSPADDP